MAKNQGEIDWKPIKTEYITTTISLRKLADKYHVGYTRLAALCAKQGWVSQREKYAEKCVAKATQKAAQKEINHLARLIDATTKAVGVAAEAFEDDQQFNRYIVQDGVAGAFETTEKIFAKVDTKALKELTGVLKDLTTLMRDFYNIPTPAQAEAQRIAAERLEMEKRKAEADRTDDSIEVVIAGEAEEWAK